MMIYVRQGLLDCAFAHRAIKGMMSYLLGWYGEKSMASLLVGHVLLCASS